MLEPRPHRIRRLHRSARPPVAPNVVDDLRFIRDTMERSAAFTAVSGWGQVLLGGTAIAAALLASRQISPFAWLRVWLAEALLAAAIGLLACTFKANRRGLPLPDRRGSRSGLAPPLVAGFTTFHVSLRGRVGTARNVVAALWRRDYDGGALVPTVRSRAHALGGLTGWVRGETGFAIWRAAYRVWIIDREEAWWVGRWHRTASTVSPQFTSGSTGASTMSPGLRNCRNSTV